MTPAVPMATYFVDPAMPFMRHRRTAALGRAACFAAIAGAGWWLGHTKWLPLEDLGTAAALTALVGGWTILQVHKQMTELRAARFDWTADELRMTTGVRTEVVSRASITSVFDGTNGFFVSSTDSKKSIHVPGDVINGGELRAAILGAGVPSRGVRRGLRAFGYSSLFVWMGVAMILLSRTTVGRQAAITATIAGLMAGILSGRRMKVDRSRAPGSDVVARRT